MRAFISYSHKDADLLTQLHEHIAVLQRQNLIQMWTDRKIAPGDVIDEHVKAELEQAQLYLVLVSSSFIASNYCIEKEFARAIERQKEGHARIVPIILRECDWEIPELKQFKALPEDGKAVTSRHWHSQDEAFSNVVQRLRTILEKPFGKEPSSESHELKAAKPKFVPDERHVTEEQRAVLRKLVDEIVDRLVARKEKDSDEEVQKAKGRWYGIVWSQFHEEFGTKENNLPSLLRERFDEARQWLLQYRASKDSNYKRNNPEKFKKALTKTIYTLAGKLGWSDPELYAFASHEVGYERLIEGLSDLGNKQLEHVRDRIRYEHTKRKVKSGQAKARGNGGAEESWLPGAEQLLAMILAHPVQDQKGLTVILRDGPSALDAYFIPNTTASGSVSSMRKAVFRQAVEQLVRRTFLLPPETDRAQTVKVYEFNAAACSMKQEANE